MRRAVLIMSGLLAIYAGWRFGMPYIDTKPDQDACTFGPVSNARYREHLLEAKRRTAHTWPDLKGTKMEKADQLRGRIADLTEGMTTIYERFAGMHATLRATGAFFTGAEIDPYRTFNSLELPDRPSGTIAPTEIHLSYSVHSNAIGAFRFFFPESSLAVHLPIYIYSELSERRGDVLRPVRESEFYVTINHPPSLVNVLFGFDSNSWWGSGPSAGCPPMPKIEWANAFDAWAASKINEVPQ